MIKSSFKPEDITLLLSPVDSSCLVTVQQKEDLILSGGHYSEVVVKEDKPTDNHYKAYATSTLETVNDLADSVIVQSKRIINDSVNSPEIVLISLVRAGCPYGVLLKRQLDRTSELSVSHYGVSIIRDKGIDELALNYILDNHPNASIYFVDGWTGKGTIFRSLKASLYHNTYWNNRPIKLVVYSDIACCAWSSYTAKDILIPFGILNSTISGLISRTVYKVNEYHGSYIFDYLKDEDVTNDFLDYVDSFVQVLNNRLIKSLASFDSRGYQQDPNKIKPGISECTRAILRRKPNNIVISDFKDSDVQLILSLGKDIPIVQLPGIFPYKAIAYLE